MQKLLLTLVLAVTAAVAVNGSPNSRRLLQTSGCPPGSFYKPFDDSCMECDHHCAVACEDVLGCTACNDGYYTSREDPEWPLRCLECDIPNCVRCRDDIFDAWPKQCVQCVDGYQAVHDRQRCEVITDVSPETLKKSPPHAVEAPHAIVEAPHDVVEAPHDVVEVPHDVEVPHEVVEVPHEVVEVPHEVVEVPHDVEVPHEVVEVPHDVVEVDPHAVEVPHAVATASPAVSDEKLKKPNVSPQEVCPDGQFYKPFDGTCMVCDPHCHAGECHDEIGCNACEDGYYSSSPDPVWPFTCVACEILHCAKCMDRVYDAWPQFCVQCEPGYALEGREKCVEVIEKDVGGEFAKRQPPQEPHDAVVVVDQPTEKAPDTRTVVDGPTSVEAVEEPDVSDVGLGKCDPGYFYQPSDHSCVLCDDHCMPDKCSDVSGCDACEDGYYTSSPDPEWPFTCVTCDIENCAKCRDGVYDTWPQICEKCAPGYSLHGRSDCVADS